MFHLWLFTNLYRNVSPEFLILMPFFLYFRWHLSQWSQKFKNLDQEKVGFIIYKDHCFIKRQSCHGCVCRYDEWLLKSHILVFHYRKRRGNNLAVNVLFH